ncbi:2-polyprenyl-6-methoxyphenol hydroxylase-like FAD-dependent oxidoreductase/heme-degrading monooxygenase HmoA [Geodermatophilus bullaregiensis]|uniref:FAD-dependent monooxygenase n=1 Tax=Geodermatophilus bullaregiensis TaxID=1564160 RepID=UPI001958DC18|nr:FAD-dependent monooxygenase [Geodermatophilus bullaregiensis]MBM7806743.1 2-polyprenyl-6-methoxyphenol hydroxylase-like FAD-dependent oxidoreductase/heme-degrading monooxygenase HmoA [Geodermatophilus bullaregiensis]
MTSPATGPGDRAVVRTVLRMRAREGCEAEFEAAWHRAAAEIARVPGNLRQELMRDEGDPRWFAIGSDWTDRASVDAFGRSAARETLTEALRDLREDATRSTFTVLATVEAERRRPVRIDFSTSVKPGEQVAFERAYRTVTERIGDSRGYVREELLRDGLRYHIFAEWESEDDFVQWVEDPSHMAAGAPLARWHSVEFRREVLEIRQRPDADADFPPLLSPGGDVEVERVRVDSAVAVEPWEQEAFELAYLAAAQLARRAPGHAREELLREPDGRRYHVVAEWDSEQRFTDWVAEPANWAAGPLGRWLARGEDRRVFALRVRPEPPSVAAAAGTVPEPARRPAALDAAVPDGVPVAPEPDLEVLAGRPVQLSGEPAAGTGPVPVGTVPSASVQEFVEKPDDGHLPAAAAPSDPGEVSRAPGRAVEVLVVGAGPAGLTHAIELARRGIAVRVVDKRPQASTQADKAIGIHCRTMEIWEEQGIVKEAMDAGIWLYGQTVFVNGEQTHQVDWAGLDELPYAHLGLPQYDTERILGAKLASHGVVVERGVELAGFTQDDEGVTARLRHASGELETTRAQYLVGCDGAHSAVRSGLGLSFEGGLSMFPQLFMLGDVDVDWDLPAGHLVRFVRIENDDDFTGMLVCVPLKGRNRYRIATLAPQRWQDAVGSGVVPPGFWQEYEPPTLADMQAAIDDLGPPGTTASNLRWSSIFRIKHGIVDRYREGRVFVAGDAAHLHPPAGGQGMNTGIQDAWNLGWKLALTVRGLAAPGLLDSYEAERRPAGKMIVDRAVSIAFTDEMDMEDEKAQFLLEMQMTMNYAGSPLVGEAPGGEAFPGGPEPGHRAPDVHGLRRFGVAHPLRLFDLTRGPRSTLLLHADAGASEEEVLALEKLATTVRQQTRGEVDAYLVADPGARLPLLVDLPVVRDADRAFAAAYGVGGSGTAAYLVRPDGHVGFRTRPVTETALLDHLAGVFDAQ